MVVSLIASAHHSFGTFYWCLNARQIFTRTMMTAAVVDSHEDITNHHYLHGLQLWLPTRTTLQSPVTLNTHRVQRSNDTTHHGNNTSPLPFSLVTRDRGGGGRIFLQPPWRRCDRQQMAAVNMVNNKNNNVANANENDSCCSRRATSV